MRDTILLSEITKRNPFRRIRRKPYTASVTDGDKWWSTTWEPKRRTILADRLGALNRCMG